METENLMIGDWVLRKGKPIQVYNVFNGSINETYYSCSNEVADYIPESEIKPILLTPEILEKNGYKYQDWWYEQEGYPDITNIFSDDMYEVGKHTYYGNGQPEFNSIIKIRYVHELQHALKLCNIEKEILI